MATDVAAEPVLMVAIMATRETNDFEVGTILNRIF